MAGDNNISITFVEDEDDSSQDEEENYDEKYDEKYDDGKYDDEDYSYNDVDREDWRGIYVGYLDKFHSLKFILLDNLRMKD